MRVSCIPVQEDFSEVSGIESGFPQQSLDARAGAVESGEDEYMPGFADTPNTAEQTQARLEPAIPTLTQPNLPIGTSPIGTTVAAQQTEPTPTNSKLSNSASQGNESRPSQLVDVQGNPVQTSETETAQTPPPLRALPSKQEPFDLSTINPLWYLALIPAILIPLLLFRFVMGTSSSYELERYKYRGPAVKDPESPNVRGRFKKKPRTDLPPSLDTDAEAKAAGNSSDNETDSSNVSVAPDDELSFLDEDDDDVSLDGPAASANDIETVVPTSLLATALTSEPVEPGDFDLHGDEDQHQFTETKANVSNFSSESETLNNHSDSDLDFDFFSDDDDPQTGEVAASDESADAIAPIELTEEASGPDELTAEGADDRTATEDQPVSIGAQSDDVDANPAFVSGESVSVRVSDDDASDDDLNLFDDSDDEFSFDESENEDELAAVAAAAKTEIEPIEEPVEAENSDSNVDLADSKDGSIGTAVAASAAGVAAVAATAKSGSWMSRLFGGRKKKQKKDAAAPVEEDALAATAVRELDDVVDSEDIGAESQLLKEPIEEPVFAESVAGKSSLADEQSAEFDFSDSSESISLDEDETFSLEGDDSSDGLFDDDSDADYNFDADEPPSTASTDLDGSAEVNEPVKVDEPAELNESEPVNVDAAETNTNEEQDSVDDFESMWDESDDLEGAAVDVPMDAQPEAHVDAQAAAKADDATPIELADQPAEEVTPVASLPAANSGDPTEEFNTLGHASGTEELPLLEDQMLDDIVASGTGNSIHGANSSLVDGASDDSNDAVLSELQRRVEELESQNAAMESDRSSLMSQLEELREASESNQLSADEQQKQEELQQQLADERQAKQELEDRLAADAESRQQAIEEAEAAKTEAEAAKAEIDKATSEAEEARLAADAAKAEAEQAAVEATEFRQKAEEAMASVRELEQAVESQNASAGSLGGSLLAAAGGAVAGATVAGGSEQPADSDDPFRLDPEQVKKMLMKLKVERKKRLKTKEHFLQVDAKRREVAQTLLKVSGELDNLKLEFEKVATASSESVSKETVNELMAKLNSAEDALKKNKRPS